MTSNFLSSHHSSPTNTNDLKLLAIVRTHNHPTPASHHGPVLKIENSYYELN